MENYGKFLIKLSLAGSLSRLEVQVEIPNGIKAFQNQAFSRPGYPKARWESNTELHLFSGHGRLPKLYGCQPLWAVNDGKT